MPIFLFLNIILEHSRLEIYPFDTHIPVRYRQFLSPRQNPPKIKGPLPKDPASSTSLSIAVSSMVVRKNGCASSLHAYRFFDD